MNKLRKHGVYYDSRIKLLLILLTSAFGVCFGWRLNRLVTLWRRLPVCFAKWTLENKYQSCNSLYSSAYVGASPSNSFIFRDNIPFY